MGRTIVCIEQQHRVQLLMKLTLKRNAMRPISDRLHLIQGLQTQRSLSHQAPK